MIVTASPSVLNSDARQSAAPPPVEIIVTAAPDLSEEAAISSLAAWLLQLAESQEQVEEMATH